MENYYFLLQFFNLGLNINYKINFNLDRNFRTPNFGFLSLGEIYYLIL